MNLSLAELDNMIPFLPHEDFSTLKASSPFRINCLECLKDEAPLILGLVGLTNRFILNVGFISGKGIGLSYSGVRPFSHRALSALYDQMARMVGRLLKLEIVKQKEGVQ